MLYEVITSIPVAAAAGFGHRGVNPAHRQSFVITEQVNAVSLEDVAAHWRTQPHDAGSLIRFKRQVIIEVARIARQLHDAGLNHQDFYLCHFWVDWPGFPQQPPPGQARIYLMDLHRMQQRRHTPRRCVITSYSIHYTKLYDEQHARDIIGQLAPGKAVDLFIDSI